MIKKLSSSISFKVGLLYSSMFLVLLLLLGYILHGLFSQMFTNYITQDLLLRGGNHAKVLANNFSQTTLDHVALMERDVITNVVVTDSENDILVSSENLAAEAGDYIKRNIGNKSSTIINQDWEEYKYVATVSPIQQGALGYVYMFYPTSVIKETVLVLKQLIALASFGLILIAVGLIILLSKRMTQPLLNMVEATNKMSEGKYLQNLNVSGDDELALLANSIQCLGIQLNNYETTRNDFLASVSHELRTPLTYIKGYSDILVKREIENREEQLSYLRIINDETKRVTHLVDDLFELSKIQTGQFTLNKEQFNLEALAKKVIENLTPLANERVIQLKLEIEGWIPKLCADPNRIEQVLYNLVENSIKYTDKGRVTLTIKLINYYLVIEVKDTGIGIPKEELSKVWDRFYRVDKSRTRKTGGTGLGLFVVKEIVTLHKGTIQLESVEGKGTTVTIFFKRSDIF